MSIVPSEGPCAPLLDFSQWGFLSTPLDELLDQLGARIVEIAVNDERFLGRCVKRDWGILIALPQHMSGLEKDLSARGLLARLHGVEITDWPMEMAFTNLEQAA